MVLLCDKIVFICRQNLIEIESQSQVPHFRFLMPELIPPFLANKISNIPHSLFTSQIPALCSHTRQTKEIENERRII